jgi:zinc transporter 1/2/3
MLTTFQWISLLSILTVTLAGGYYPLFNRQKARDKKGLPLAEAFTAGVFIALSLTLMLPSSLHVLGKAYPGFDFPTGALVAILTFLTLLAMEHRIENIRRSVTNVKQERNPPVIPLAMTAMIAIPSFFLGTALGVSSTETAILIFVAIMMHKSSAAFALALKMVRSTLTRNQVAAAFLLFACSTPAGIIVGEEIHLLLDPHTLMVVKGVVLGLASGTFLYIATLHELQNAPMITSCATGRGFVIMLTGMLLTGAVRLLIGEAHMLAGA